MAKTKYNKIVGLVIIVIALIVAIVTIGQNNGKSLSLKEAEARTLKFVNEYLLDGEEEATIAEITEYNSGLYLVKVSLESYDEPIDSYITKDGDIFFPQALDIAEMMGEKEDGDNVKKDDEKETDPVVKDMVKKDKPEIELFVMSHCPFGTQIEKGMIPVIETLWGKVDFQLKFVDYAMHGEKELKEQMNEYCIQKEQAPKLLPYLNCFLEAGDTENCLTKTGVDRNKLTACYNATDKEFKVMELFKDESTWFNGRFPQFNVHKADNEKYGVGGSPTLIINGTEVSSARDSASLLRNICEAFTTKPAECDKELSSASPSSGFGKGTTQNATEATCN